METLIDAAAGSTSGGAGHAGGKVTVQVTYNGVTKPLEVNLSAATKAALEAALNLFNIHENRHTMSLFTGVATELDDNRSLSSQGIEADNLLVLRPSTVKGGRK